MSNKTLALLSSDSFLHAWNRGVDQGKIFFQPGDYEVFLDQMIRSLKDARLQLLAYCLMPSHYHLILYQEISFAVSEYIKKVCEKYAKATNRKIARHGHLFGSRFKVRRATDAADLLLLSRYVHLNPVEASLVQHPIEWRTSSFRQYSGIGAELVNARPILGLVGGSEAYLRFIEGYNPLDPEPLSKYLVKPANMLLSRDCLDF